MAKPAPFAIERRSEERISAHLDLASYLKIADSGVSVRAILVDISTIGIGIRSLDFLKADTLLHLSLKEEKISFRVAWSRSDVANESLWHIGLLSMDSAIDLKSWFERQGVLMQRKIEK